MPKRTNISSGSPFEGSIGFSRAVRVGDRVLVSGTAPVWRDGSSPDDPTAQARRCFEIIGDALAEAGTDLMAVIRTRMYLTDPNAGDAVSAEHGRLFGQTRPAATMVIVTGAPRWKVEIEAEALIYPVSACASTQFSHVNIGTGPFDGSQLWTSRSLEGASSPLLEDGVAPSGEVDLAGVGRFKRAGAGSPRVAPPCGGSGR